MSYQRSYHIILYHIISYHNKYQIIHIKYLITYIEYHTYSISSHIRRIPYHIFMSSLPNNCFGKIGMYACVHERG